MQQPAIDIHRIRRPEIRETVALISHIFNQHTSKIEPLFQGILSERFNCPAAYVATAPDQHVIGAVFCEPLHVDIVREEVYGIAYLAVDPDFRKQGLGHKLMEEAEAYVLRDLRGEPGLIVLADSTKDKNPASRFYEKMGYSDNYFPIKWDPQNHLVLAKPLNVTSRPSGPGSSRSGR